MKVIVVLLVVHLLVCGIAAHYFRERVETRIEQPPESRFSEVRSTMVGPPPAAVLIYGAAGLLALVAAFCYEVYRRIHSLARFLNTQAMCLTATVFRAGCAFTLAALVPPHSCRACLSVIDFQIVSDFSP